MVEEKIAKISVEAKEYLEIKRELTKLQVIELLSNLIASSIKGIVFSVLGLMILMFFSISMGLWLNEILESNYYGFLLVTGFYAFMFIIIYLIRNSVLGQNIKDKMVNLLHKSWEDNN